MPGIHARDVSGHFMAIKHHPELMKNVIQCSPVSADLKLHYKYSYAIKQPQIQD
jgi:hypothetical protein